MKRHIITLSIVLLLVSCATSGLSDGFSVLSKAGSVPAAEEQDASDPVQEDVTEPEESEEPDLESMTEEERYAYEVQKSRERYELLEQYHAEIDPEYVPVPWETYWESLQSPQDEPEPEVEEITPVVEEKSPEPTVERQETVVDKLMEGTAPNVLLYLASFLFLASLFTVCYISKQRKESYWHRFRD